MATTMASTTPLTGCVKWFDNGLNYGFITVVSEGANHNADIFVHQSNIRTKRDCFRTLYTGECVQFELAKSDNEKHPFHAVNVTGFNGAQLHCENPNYRGVRSGRGGFRGNGRGGYQRYNDSNRAGQTPNVVKETVESSKTSENQSNVETTSQSATTSENTTSVTDNVTTTIRGRGRGRGRGKSSV